MFSPVAVPAVMAAFWLSKYELKFLMVNIERQTQLEIKKKYNLRELRAVVTTITLCEKSKFTALYESPALALALHDG